MISSLRLIGLFFAATAAQWWLSTYMAPGGASPQLLLVLTVGVAARYGAVRAMIAGFLWGLFLDVLGARLLGANALALTLVGYVTGSVRRQLDVIALGPQCVLVAGMTWGYFLLLGLLGLLFLKNFLWVGWAPFIVDPLLNCFAAFVIALFWRDRGEFR